MLTIIISTATIALVIALIMREAWFGYPPSRFVAQALSRKEQAILRASAEAFFPEGGALPSGEQAGIVAYVDGMMADLPRRQRVLLRLLLILVEHGSLIFGPVRSRITRQTLEQRTVTFRDWETSEIYLRRLSFLSLRTLMTLAYFGYAEVRSTLMPANV